MTKRKLNSWIDAYLEYTEHMGCPSIFCLWSALATIAGAMERKVWVTTGKGPLYPNLYTLLIGEPGVGKTIQTDLVWRFWESLSGAGTDTHKTALQSINHATIIDELRDAERKIVRPADVPPIISFNSLLIAVNDFPVLLPVYDTAMMAKLTDLYDCKVYGERRRGRDINFRMDNTQLNLLSAIPPSTLRNLLPDGAWDQGFLSRTILIYSGEMMYQDLWISGKEKSQTKLYEALVHDLNIIAHLYTACKFTPEAKEAINNWHKAKGPPRPNHPKLLYYCHRRTSHLFKLCMAVCASHTDDMIVTIDHYTTALTYLLEAEKSMPDIFKAMTSGGDGQIMAETWHFVYQLYMSKKNPEPVREAVILHFISERATAHSTLRILEIMTRAGILAPADVNKIGKCYIPKPRKPG